jgi:RND family efflux transporter MFP subunit
MSRLHATLPLLLVFALACQRGDGQSPPGRGGPGGERPPTPVEVAQATLDTVSRSMRATGTVEPIRTIVVVSQLPGALLSVEVEEGDRVRRGELLARIDSRELQAQMRSAKATLEVARRAAERSEQLRAQQIITVAEYEADQAAYAAALATHDQLQTRINYATVRAPITGVVLEKLVEGGHVVANQSRLFTIGDVDPLVVRVPVSELDVTALAAGDTVQVTLDAMPGADLVGRIRRIFPAADSSTRLVPVEVALAGSSSGAVRPGFLARVSFALAPRSGVLTVPAGAVLEAASGSAVFLVDDGRAVRRRVQRGETYEGRIEITSGLSPGDTVVVAGNAELRDGAAVRLSQSPAPATATSRTEAGVPVERGAP